MTSVAPVSKKSLLAYSAGKILPGVVLFVAVPLWTRAFGAEQYGLYAIAWSVTLFSSSLTTGWLRQALLRHSGATGADLRDLPRWVLPTVTLASTVPVALLVVLQLQHSTAPAVLLAVALAFAALNSTYTVMQAVAQRYGQSSRYTAAEIVRVVVAVALSLVLGSWSELEGASCIVLAFVVGTVAGLAVLRAKKMQHARQPHYTRRAALPIFWRYGWPMTIWLASSALLLYVDRLIISATLGPEAAGEYAAVSDVIVRGFAMLTFPLTMVSHPIVMRAWNAGKRADALATNAVYRRYLLVLASGTIIVGAVLGRPVLEGLLSIDVSSPYLVPLLLAGAGLWQAGLMTHKELELTDRTRTMAGLVVGITLLSAAANVVLTPVVGIVGPATVFAIGAAIYTISTAMLGSSTRKRVTT